MLALVLLFSVQASSNSLPAPVAQEARPLKSLRLDLAALEAQSTRTYDLVLLDKKSGSGEPVGTLVADTRIQGEQVLISDSWTMLVRGKERKLAETLTCNKDNFLSPTHVTVKGDGDEGPFVLDASVRSADPLSIWPGILRAEPKDVLPLPPQMLSNNAWLRILGLLPRVEGVIVSVPFWLETEELHLKKEYVIECAGPATLQLGERTVACTRYVTRGGIGQIEAWVDGEGVVQRVLSGSTQWTLRTTNAKPGAK